MLSCQQIHIHADLHQNACFFPIMALLLYPVLFSSQKQVSLYSCAQFYPRGRNIHCTDRCVTFDFRYVCYQQMHQLFALCAYVHSPANNGCNYVYYCLLICNISTYEIVNCNCHICTLPIFFYSMMYLYSYSTVSCLITVFHLLCRECLL